MMDVNEFSKPAKKARYEVSLYRTVTHHRYVFIEAESADAAHDVASRIVESACNEGVEVGWKHNRSELGVRYVKRSRSMTETALDHANAELREETDGADDPSLFS